MSTLFTTASFGSPASFLVLFFSIESISNHHNCLYMFIYSFTVCLHTHIHTLERLWNPQEKWFLCFVRWCFPSTLRSHRDSNKYLSKGRRKERKEERGKEGGKKKEKRARVDKIAWCSFSECKNPGSTSCCWILWCSPFSFYIFPFFDLSSFECVRFLCNQIIWQQQVWWVILVSF